jgi:hypothetical protein
LRRSPPAPSPSDGAVDLRLFAAGAVAFLVASGAGAGAEGRSIQANVGVELKGVSWR